MAPPRLGAAWLALLVLVLAAAAPALAERKEKLQAQGPVATLPVYHTLTPTAEQPPAAPWVLRGSLRVPLHRPSGSSYEDGQHPAELKQALAAPATADTIYQVAVVLRPDAVSLSTVPLVAVAAALHPQCAFQSVGYKDRFLVHLDTTGNVSHVAHTIPAVDCKAPGERPAWSGRFQPTITLTAARAGVRPQTTEMRQDPRGPGATQPAEEQSFFQKYWYYIMIFLVTMTAANIIAPNAAPPQNGGGGGAAARGR